MISLKELQSYLKDLYETDDFKDYCPKGLVVEGKENIEKGIAGVSFTLELVEKAVEEKTDFIIVHHPHGFWNNESQTIQGIQKKKVKLLLEHDISLFGFHLPMDAQPELGNNAQLAKALGLKHSGGFMKEGRKHIGYLAEYDTPMKAHDFIELVKEKVGPCNQVFDYGPDEIKTVGICTGAAPNGIQEIVDNIDCYITGEARENTQYYVKEHGKHFLAAGHHQTERFGPKAIALHLEEKYNIPVPFIDIYNPV